MFARFSPHAVLVALLCTQSYGFAANGETAEKNGLVLFEKHVQLLLKQHCYRCHSHAGKRSRGGLVLDSRDALRKGGDSGPAIVPGRPDKSLMIKAVSYTDKDLRMPPKGKLPQADIERIREWIALGAPDPRKLAKSVTPRKKFEITEADRRHWSFQPIVAVKPPPVKNNDWAVTRIDQFVLAKLEEKSLSANRKADRYALLRRATFDLTGLPPTPEQIESFVNDESPKAFEKVVNRMLESKQFGERWARHWLDGVRYASNIDTTGTYRDWVVRAFNEDLPHNQFIRLQIAGDLIPAQEKDPTKIHESGASLDGVAATGMLSLAVWELVARDLAVAEIVDSQIDVVSRQFLGLTMACARCHDHKYDPISNKDYYAMSGIFFSSHISPGKLIADGRLSADVIRIPLLNKVDAEKNRRIDGKINDLKKEIATLEKKAGPAATLKNTQDEIKTLTTKAAKAKGSAKKKLQGQIKKLRSKEKKLLADHKKRGWPKNPPELAAIDKLQIQAAALKKTKVVPVSAIAAQDGGIKGSNRAKIGDAPIYIRGDHRKEGEVVPRRFPTILAGDNQEPLGKLTQGSGRLELANWIASEKNPLTARVMSNRIWMHLFAKGLVRTPDNFGNLGEPPTHPKLLDYLARRFIDSGWSVKRLIKEIMLTSTYQQSSFADSKLLKADPANRLLGRMNRKRLEYEALRDSVLLISGQLKLSARSGKSSRTLYQPNLRKKFDVVRMMFDGADPHAIVPERAVTTTATQALFMMNNPFIINAARYLENRFDKERSLKSNKDFIRRAYLAMFGRPPTKQETHIGNEYVALASRRSFLQVLFCTNEFLYLD